MVSVWGDVMSGFEGSHGTPSVAQKRVNFSCVL